MLFKIRKFFRYFLFFVIFWTALIVILSYLNYNSFYNNTLSIVKSSALDGFNKDLVYRRWATIHGGVYVSVTPETPPNQWLSHIPERDISTPSGKKLTLVNPAYMTRQVHELGAIQYGLKGHITSLNPLRPENAPDDWESKSLHEFNNGVSEVNSVELIDGEEYYRYMQAMITEEGCLKCHSQQGYKVGDIRGGISVSVPWEPLKSKINDNLLIIFITYGLIWLIGCIASGFIFRRICRDFRKGKLIEKVLQESELKYKSLFTYMDQGMALHEIILDKSGAAINYKFLEVNESFEKLTGLKREDIIGRDVLEILPGTEKMWIERYGEVVESGIPARFEDYARDLKKYFEVVAYKTQPGQFAVILSDVTDRRLYEDAMLLKNEDLQKLNAEKDKFFTILAHDLKSPFNSILGFSDLLIEKIENKDMSEIEKYANIINDSSKRTMDLLRNLIEWAQSQTGRMIFKPENFEIINIINDTSKLFTDIAEQKSISIIKKLHTSTPLFADKSMISAILRNLISNAIKFTHKGGEIIISAEENQNGFVFKVSDTGVGMPANSIDKLFSVDENFSTPGTQNEKGTGLGLILCKEFVEKHGGKIWVESEEGKGSIFSFSIPQRRL